MISAFLWSIVSIVLKADFLRYPVGSGDAAEPDSLCHSDRLSYPAQVGVSDLTRALVAGSRVQSRQTMAVPYVVGFDLDVLNLVTVRPAPDPKQAMLSHPSPLAWRERVSIDVSSLTSSRLLDVCAAHIEQAVFASR
jgi:hypothetical protein